MRAASSSSFPVRRAASPLRDGTSSADAPPAHVTGSSPCCCRLQVSLPGILVMALLASPLVGRRVVHRLGHLAQLHREMRRVLPLRCHLHDAAVLRPPPAPAAGDVSVTSRPAPAGSATLVCADRRRAETRAASALALPPSGPCRARPCRVCGPTRSPPLPLPLTHQLRCVLPCGYRSLIGAGQRRSRGALFGTPRPPPGQLCRPRLRRERTRLSGFCGRYLCGPRCLCGLALGEALDSPPICAAAGSHTPSRCSCAVRPVRSDGAAEPPSTSSLPFHEGAPVVRSALLRKQ